MPQGEESKKPTKPAAPNPVPFAVGGFPVDAALDGTNVWVTNRDENTVTKLRASDGANLGSFAVGNFPQGVVFDGTNMWVSGANSDNVTQLRASDAANLGTFGRGNSRRTGTLWLFCVLCLYKSA